MTEAEGQVSRISRPDVTPDYYMKCYVERPLGGAIEINRTRPKTVSPPVRAKLKLD